MSVENEDSRPVELLLHQNSPNPFNLNITIAFTVLKAGDFTLDVCNLAGQKVDAPLNGHQGAGSYSVTWDGSCFSAGLYFYRVTFDGLSQTKKMLFIK